tara:strand:- start:1081 stop:1356 length:276 start_codon:yes stop_codon:yes gene_type:complete
MNPFSNIGKLSEDEREIERIEQQIKYFEDRISGIKNEIRQMSNKAFKTEYSELSIINRTAEIRTRTEKLHGLIAWQNNRSRQANTVIKRNF